MTAGATQPLTLTPMSFGRQTTYHCATLPRVCKLPVLAVRTQEQASLGNLGCDSFGGHGNFVRSAEKLFVGNKNLVQKKGKKEGDKRRENMTMYWSRWNASGAWRLQG